MSPYIEQEALLIFRLCGKHKRYFTKVIATRDWGDLYHRGNERCTRFAPPDQLNTPPHPRRWKPSHRASRHESSRNNQSCKRRCIKMERGQSGKVVNCHALAFSCTAPQPHRVIDYSEQPQSNSRQSIFTHRYFQRVSLIAPAGIRWSGWLAGIRFSQTSCLLKLSGP